VVAVPTKDHVLADGKYNKSGSDNVISLSKKLQGEQGCGYD